MAQLIIPLKQGDSFDRLLTIPVGFEDGFFVGWGVSSQLIDSDGAVLDRIDTEWADPLTTRTLRLFKIDTTAWPQGSAIFDVQFTRASDGYVVSTTTAKLKITKDVTAPATP